MRTFIHAADIHLDSPLKGLIPYEGAPDVADIRGATRQALDNLVEFAISEGVPLVIIAGDLYDGDWQDFNTGLYFASQMRRLNQAGIRVAVVRGNHDAANKMTRTLVMPENVKVFKARRAETWVLDDLQMAVHGRSYAAPDTRDNLALAYPEPVPGMLNIGVLHCLISGAQGHQTYAPCTLDDLSAKGYDYWALGHVHEYAVLRRQPLIVYPGCSQGRHIRETGPKGCVLVEADNGGLKSEFAALDVFRWVRVVLDVSGARQMNQVLSALAEALPPALADQDGRPCCVRIFLQGACPIHGRLTAEPETLEANVRAVAAEVSQGTVWIEKIILQTRPAMDLEALAASDTPQGELLRFLDTLSLGSRVTRTRDLDLDLASLKGKLAGSGVKVPEDHLDQLIASARDTILTLLSDAETREGRS